MKPSFSNRFSHLVFISIISLVLAQKSGAQKSLNIYISSNQKDLKALAQDLADNLARASGLNYSIDSNLNPGNTGISLRIEKVAPDSLRNQGYEMVGTDHSLVIRANQLNGLRNGVYNYLYKLGFRFYLPGDNWTHVPSLSSVFINVNEKRYPLFGNRSMFGTGGFPYNWTLDPKSTVQKQWETWLTRTNWSSEEYIAGHIGEDFNTKYQNELKADTSLLARYNGRRQWSLGSKWCVSNTKFQAMFIKDRLDAFALQKIKTPERDFISVEPADGGGYCQCENCAKIGTASDQVFFLANLVAREIKKKWPEGGVSLYAYADHAAMPKERLDDNVYVDVIPYAFQLIAVPEILLSEWRKKCTLMGVYDYWNLTDGSKDLPKLNYLLYVPQKIEMWTRLGVKGYNLESGYSKFGSGMFLYFLSRIAWDKNADINELLSDFCLTNFGAASNILKDMFSRWSTNFDAHQEVSRALDDIKKARQLTKDTSILSRLKEVEDYVYYAAYYTDASDHFNSGNTYQKVENCIRYIWTVYNECLLNTSRIHQYFLLRPVRDNQKPLVDKWSLANTAAQKDLWNSFKDPNANILDPHALLDPDFFVVKQNSQQMLINGADARLQELNMNFNANDTLRFNCGKTIYFSFNSGNETSFSLKVKLSQQAAQGTLPGAALYELNKKYKNYVLLDGKPGNLQSVKFDGLKKNTRYYILVNIPGMLCEVRIPNKAIIIDATNTSNSYISLQTSQKVYFMLDPRATSYDFNTQAFKGNVYSDKRASLDLGKSSKPLSKTSGLPYMMVEQKGSNTLALTAKGRESLYFFK